MGERGGNLGLFKNYLGVFLQNVGDFRKKSEILVTTLGDFRLNST